MHTKHSYNIPATGIYFFHSSLRKFSSGKTCSRTPGPSRQHDNVPKHILILKARHICCAHLGPRSSTLHVAAHLVPHGSTLGMSRHACNPTAKARRRGRWAWNLSKAQILPAAPVRNTYCSRPTELST